jgi:bacteriorhodopsin
MYFIKMLDYKHTIIGGYVTDTYLNHFFIEWIFTTPLIISQFAVVSGLGLHRSVCLVTMDIFMILCGYISYISKHYDVKVALFSVGCLNFVAIAAFVATALSGNPKQGLKKTTYCVLSLWALYPCTHLLYITHHIRLHSVVWVFSLLDVLVKGIILNATVTAYYYPLIYQQLPYA